MATLGQQLKTAREAKGVSQGQAGVETKILTRLIVAMEEDNFAAIAAPAYAKGFIRLYAEYLGIDPEPLINEYMAQHAPRARPVLHEESQLHKSRHPVSPFSAVFERIGQFAFLPPKNKPEISESEDASDSEAAKALRAGPDVRLIAGVVAGLIVLMVLILGITNCARRRGAEKSESAEPQVEAARKLLDEPLPDLYLSEPGKIESSR